MRINELGWGLPGAHFGADLQAITQGAMNARHDYPNAELDQDIGNPPSRWHLATL
jgi:hypothetical protein